MGTVAVTSNDTLTLNNRVFADLSTDDVTALVYQTDLINLKTGKNNNTIYAKNEQGRNGMLTLRLMRGSSDDQFMNGIIAASAGDFPSTKLLAGTFVKRIGDGDGKVTSDTYVLKGGVVSRGVDAKENVSGDVSQAESVYTVKFAQATRNIG